MSENRQTVLVTGAAGFVGSHLCKRLVAMGHRGIAPDNYCNGTTNKLNETVLQAIVTRLEAR